MTAAHRNTLNRTEPMKELSNSKAITLSTHVHAMGSVLDISEFEPESKNMEQKAVESDNPPANGSVVETEFDGFEYEDDLQREEDEKAEFEAEQATSEQQEERQHGRKSRNKTRLHNPKNQFISRRDLSQKIIENKSKAT